jgi:hypothetical protein
MSRFKSIQERKKSIFEDGCASCGGGGMSVGDGGFGGDAAPEGPVSGYDPLMGKLDKVRKKRKKKVA